MEMPKKLDWVLLGVVIVLLVIGIIMLISSSSVVGFANFHDLIITSKSMLLI